MDSNSPARLIADPLSSGVGAASVVLDAAMAVAQDFGRSARRAPSPTHDPQDSFDKAVALYEGAHWADAFAMLSRLADHGHVPASKLALLMLRYGEPLYATVLLAEPPRIARWARQVLDAGRVVAPPAILRMEPLRPSASQRALRATSRATASPTSITAMA